jgi:hypothetical protein
MKSERRPQCVFMDFVSFLEWKTIPFLHIAATELSNGWRVPSWI